MGKDLNGKNLGKGFSQRKDGRYEARAVIKGIKIDLYNKSLSALKKQFAEAKNAALSQLITPTVNITVSEWYNEWFNNCKGPNLKSDVCRKTYDRKMRNTYLKLIGDKKMDKLSQMDIQMATNELIENNVYARRGVTEAMHSLKECMDVAIANRIITSNPVVGINIRNVNVAPKERRVLSPWEQEAFIEEISGGYYYEAYMLLLLTGMRIGEFSGLQWGDVDFERKEIHIMRSMTTAYIDGRKVEELLAPKTFNSYRIIPFIGDAEKYLKAWKKKQDYYKKKLGSRWRADETLGDLVFTTTLGSPVTRYNIVHDLKRVEKNIKLREEERARIEGRAPREFGHLHPHAFRHTFATRCFEKGFEPLVVQSIMGHSNYSTTISYTHVLSDKINETVAQAGTFLC